MFDRKFFLTFFIRLLLLGGVGPCWVVSSIADARGPLRLRDQAGRWVLPLADHGQKATLLFFLTTDCPVGNRYAPEIARIAQHYQKNGVNCFAVFAAEKPEEIARYLRDYQLSIRALLDPALALAKRTAATITPEACVLSPSGSILYRGRIDDRVAKLGTMRPEPRVRDLRLALDAVLAGKPVAVPLTKAMGCYIAPASSTP